MATDYPGAIDSFDTHVDNVDDVMAADVNDLNDAVVATQTALAVSGWSTWTPTVDQNGAVAATVTQARYKIVNKICHTEVQLNVTAAGDAGEIIIIGGQGAAIQPEWTGGSAIIGTVYVSDTGTALYPGVVVATAADGWQFIGYAETNYMGVDPNFALANTDVISINATYEVA